MDLKNKLRSHLHIKDIRNISIYIDSDSDETALSRLYASIFDEDELTASNALWVLTHCSPETIDRLTERRDEMIDLILSTPSIRIRRLMMTLIERQRIPPEDIRVDFIDFCLEGINSTFPFGVRALCMKLAFKMCRNYPELIDELKIRIGLMEDGELSPGILSVKRNIEKQIITVR